MTIPSNEAFFSGPYNGNGVTTEFDYDFKIYDDSDLVVTRTNADDSTTVLTLTTDYTVVGAGENTPATRRIVLASGALLPTGASLIIEPDVPASQDRPLRSQSSTSLIELENAFDKLTSVARRLEGFLTRVPKVAVTETAGLLEITDGNILVGGPSGSVVVGPTVMDLNTALALTPRVVALEVLTATLDVDLQAVEDELAAVSGSIVGTSGAQMITGKTFLATVSGAAAALFRGVAGDAGRVTTFSDKDSGVVSVYGGTALDDGGGSTGYGSMQIGVLDNTATTEEGYIQFAPATGGANAAQVRIQGGAMLPVTNTVELGNPANPWAKATALAFETPAWATYYGAVGDGVTDNKTELDNAFAAGAVYLPEGTFRYVGVPPTGAVTYGPGKLVYEEAGYNPQTWGNVVVTGTSETRGGATRVARAGGVWLGGIENHIALNDQGCDSYFFMRAETQTGQSILATLVGDPRFALVEGTSGTNTMTVRDAGTFNTDFFQVGKRVLVNGKSCRITAASTASCTVEEWDGTAISWDADWSHTAILPQHTWDCVADISGDGTVLTITGGVPEDVSGSVDEVLIKLGGTYYTVASASDARNYVLDTALPLQTDVDIEVVWMRSYSAQWTLKWLGGNEEQTVKWMLEGDAVRMRVDNSGQWSQGGVEQHLPFAVAIGPEDVHETHSTFFRVLKQLLVLGNATMQQLAVEATLIAEFIRPNTTNAKDVGSNNFRFRRGWFREIKFGTSGDMLVTSGTTAPEGNVAAARGSLYLYDTGGTAELWFKATGFGNTGWVLK